MATMMEIEEAIKSIESKKQSLKQSFDLLLQHSHPFSPFTLSWPQIDSHFSLIQSSLHSRFSLLQHNLQSLPQFHLPNPENAQSLPESDKNPKKGQKIRSLPQLERTPDGKNPKNGQNIQSLPKSERTPDGKITKNGEKMPSLPESKRAPDGKTPKNGQKEQSLFKLEKNEDDPDDKNPQKERLKSACEKMDSKELRRLVQICKKSNGWGANELSQAVKHAPDPYKLVLYATEECSPRGLSSVILLESLTMIEGVKVSEELRDRAKCMAIKWKDELDKDDKFIYNAMSLLSLLGVFKLVHDFDKEDVLEIAYIISKNFRAINLCRVHGLEDRIPELVQKLIDNKRELVAIKFIQEFKLGDRFSCGEILRSYLRECQNTATQIRKNMKNDPSAMNDGDEKEKAALKLVIKCIKDYKLESEFSPHSLEKRLKKIDKLKDKRKAKKALQQRDSVCAPPLHYLPPPLFLVGPPLGVGPSSVAPHGLSGSFLGYATSPSTHAMRSQVPSSSGRGRRHFVDAYAFPHQPYYPQ